MAQGTVRWFDDERGFGFIAVDDGGPDVFVTWNDITRPDGATLREGESVSFEIKVGSKGPQAQRVRPS
ncbi:cold-shock protein [Nocardia sp. NPDC051570]|uniref:cold-shock protein n=1 Tax=Nocardia sp. NPDC051570 TaxID=3364324 RepID=UPI003792DE4F